MDHILLIKSSSRAYRKVSEQLRVQHPASTVDVLATSESGQSVEAEPETGEIITVEKGTFGDSALTDNERSLLKQKEYDLVVVLCNNIYDFGYENVEKMARQVRCGNLVAMDVYLRRWKLTGMARWGLLIARVLRKPALLFLDLLTILFILGYFLPALIWRHLKNALKGTR